MLQDLIIDYIQAKTEKEKAKIERMAARVGMDRRTLIILANEMKKRGETEL